MNRLAAVVACCLFLAACVASESGVNALGPSVSEIQAMPVKEAETHLAGKTVMTFIERHKSCPPNLYATGYCEWIDGPGTQVEFFTDDGRWFLWSPENAELASGKWILRDWRERHHLCVAADGEATNVLARFVHDDGFGCVLLAEYAGKITEARQADSFGLSDGRTPFPLNDEPTTIDALLQGL